jgi:hypothetical protein
MPAQRDFNSVSPSAKVLLFMKSLTDIPFAKEAVNLIFTEEDVKEKGGQHLPKGFFGRLLHFENRYWSINKLMESTGIKNIMEISSGFSFRGLDKVLHDDVFYIDTDLPDLIADKRDLIVQLLDGRTVRGTLMTEALNVLDEKAFLNLINHFPPGPICIVNEGLLMYLNPEEKQKLGAIIYKVLKERGGCWITADVYIKNSYVSKPDDYGPYAQKIAEFLAVHHVEENKFESFDAAKSFFEQCGFKIDQTEVIAYDKLSSLKYVSDKTEVTENIVKQWMNIRQTWMLKVKE